MWRSHTLMYWPVDCLTPWGWRDAGPLGGNHGAYSYLIERTWLGAILNRHPMPVRDHLRIGKRSVAT